MKYEQPLSKRVGGEAPALSQVTATREQSCEVWNARTASAWVTTLLPWFTSGVQSLRAFCRVSQLFFWSLTYISSICAAFPVIQLLAVMQTPLPASQKYAELKCCTSHTSLFQPEEEEKGSWLNSAARLYPRPGYSHTALVLERIMVHHVHRPPRQQHRVREAFLLTAGPPLPLTRCVQELVFNNSNRQRKLNSLLWICVCTPRHAAENALSLT